MPVADIDHLNALDTTDNPLEGYKLVSLPNLSTARCPPDERETYTFEVHKQATDALFVTALARCLGAYCGVNDVLLGWQRVAGDESVADQGFMAARICWEDTATWENLQQHIATVDIGEDSASISRALGIEEDTEENPFLAIVSSDANYDHHLVAWLNGETNTVILHYSTLVFHSSTAELLANHVDALVRHILEHPESTPKSLSFLPRSLLSIVEQNEESSYVHLPVARTAAQYVANSAAAYPTSTALEFYPDLYEDGALEHVQTLSYGELHHRSNQFAAYLLDRGLEQEDRVALCMARGIEFHVCMLGILKAGGCYVPIDPELPDERRNFIAQDSAARFVFTAENVQEHIRNAQDYPDTDIDVARPEGLSYMLYTSGTTGTPKGCLLTHDGLTYAIHALSWYANQAGPNKRKWPQKGRYLGVASVAFDVHLAETFAAFALGMTLASGPRTQLLEDLPRWIDELHVTHIGIVPSLIEATMVAVAESFESAENGDNAGRVMELAYIASGGEKMSDAILERWADHPMVTLANFYGPSEVTIGCTARLMTSNTRKENIGWMFESCSAYVVDENLNILMRGGVGELLVGGHLVGRGYHNRPDLTEKAFIDFEGEKAYRTGDLVRLMPDDSIEILGRIDTQIKLRGVRIESEGISAVIRKAAKAFPGLTSLMKAGASPDVSTVLTRHPLLQTDQLVTFIAWDSSVSIKHRRTAKPRVLSQTPRGLMKALKEACARELPSYMRPAHIVPMDFLPLNVNGKTENKALISIFQVEGLESLSKAGLDRQDAGGDVTPRPLTEIERRIADAVVKFTAVPRERLLPTSNLFELGFDSLKLVRLATTLLSEFSRPSNKITIAELIQSPTIEELGDLLASNQELATSTHKESFSATFEKIWRLKIEELMDAGGVESVLHTFPVQDGVLYRSADLETLYIQHVLLRLNEDVSVEKLKSAWEKLLAYHPILRTVFQFLMSIVQVVLKLDACELPWSERVTSMDDPGSFTSQFFEGDAEDIARDINQNISTKPPFRLTLFRSPSGVFLSVAIHHSIYDGISLDYILKDVETVYAGNELTSSIPPGQVLDEINSVDQEDALQFWKGMFNGFDWAKIPGRLASAEVASTVSLEFREPLQSWEEMAAKAKVSLQALLMSSFGVCLGRNLYGVSDVSFGVIRSGRSFADERMNESRYPLLSVNPMRVRASEDSNFIHEVQRDIGRSLPFEFFPLSRLQPVLRPGKTLFEALFSLSINEGSDSAIWQLLKSAQPQADYILAVEVVLDRKTGRIHVDSAFTEPLSSRFISELLEDMEITAQALAKGTLTRSDSSNGLLSPTLVSSHVGSLDSEDESEDDSAVPVDEGLEAKIRTVVSRFLQIDEENISITTSLITLGLDSIKSVGLARLLRQQGLKLTAVELMRNPTIRRIAAHQHPSEGKHADREERQAEAILDESLAEIKANFDLQSARLNDDDTVEIYPTTELQSGMLSQTIGSGGRLYVHPFPFKLFADVDLERLKEALRRTIHANSILRTSFHFIPNLGRWIQAVHSNLELNWNEVELDDDSSVLHRVEEWINVIDFSSEASFAKPPVYMRLYRTSAGTSEKSRTLVLVLHHALYDGISMSRFSDVLVSYYHNEQPAPASQFVDLIGYFLFQERYGPQYWLNVLSNFKRTHLPKSERISRLPNQSAVQSEVTIPVTVKQFGQACMEFDATTQCFGQAALAKILARLYEKHDVVFGRVVSGRNTVQAENVIGPMITTLPCRVTFSRQTTNLELVRMIHRGNTSSLRWQHLSLRATQRNLGQSSLWDAILVFQPAIDEDKTSRLWHFDDSEDEVVKIQYPLNFELYQQNECMIVKAACQSAFMNETDLKALLESFSQAMKDILDDPQAIAMHDFPISDGDSVGSLEDQNEPINGSNASHEKSFDDLFSSAHFRKLLEIISACTRIPPSVIRPDSSMVSLGVDSISAIQISSKARLAGLNLHAAAILRCETASDLCSVVSLEGQGHSVNVEEPFTYSVSSTLRSALLQRIGASIEWVGDVYLAPAGIKWLVGMWQLSGRSRFQHAFAFKLPRGVDKGRLKSAWSRVASESSILRSTFASTDPSNLHIIEFKEFPPQRLWSEQYSNGCMTDTETVSEVMRKLTSSPLSTAYPPAQAVFLHHNQSSYFIIHLHHFQYDAWSLKLLINDIEQAYIGNAMASTNDRKLFVHYYLTKSAREQQKQYWTTYLPHPFTPSLLPRIISNLDDHTSGRDVFTATAALENLPLLRQRALQLSVSLNSVFLACWARVQAAYSRADSATFGLWHLGRTGGIVGLENLAYPCMNVLPIHIETSKPSIREICEDVQRMLRKRTAIIEQSDLEDVSDWVANPGILCNVFVNIVVTFEDETDSDSSRNRILEPVDIRYQIPDVASTDIRPSAERLTICDLLQDALMIDIMANRSDVLISLEYSKEYLQVAEVQRLIKTWADTVRDVLHIQTK